MTTWTNSSGQPISAANLNKIEQGIFDAHTAGDNAKQAGATGNGSTDDTSALQSWLNAGGGYLPPGNYLVASSLNAASGAKIVAHQNARIFGSVASALVNLAGSNLIQGVIFENTGTPGSAMGLNWSTGATNTHVLNNIFRSSNAHQIRINTTGVANVLITGNRIENGRYGILIDSSATDVKNIRIIGNDVLTCTADAIEVNTPGSAYAGARDVTIAGNYLKAPSGTGNSGFGIGIAGGYHYNIYGNTIEGANRQGIHLEDEAKHVSVANNVIDGGNEDAIYIQDCDYLSVTGNHIRGAVGNGIYCVYDATNQVTEAVISSNTVTACGAAGIYYGGNQIVGDVAITHNISHANTGDGIVLSGKAGNIRLLGNTSRGNTGYGLTLEGPRQNARIRDNLIYSNTAGMINYTTLGHAVQFDTHESYGTGVVSTGFTPYVIGFPLGIYAKGLVTVFCKEASNNAEEVYDITWNSTTSTLTGTTPIHSRVGTLNPEIRANAGNLEARSAGTNGTTVEIQVRFDGTMLLR